MSNKLKLQSLLNCFNLSVDKIGSACWWQKIELVGSPFIRRQDNQSNQVLFLWQDIVSCDNKSDIVKVLLDVNSLIDHHSWDPVSLEKVGETDIWFAQIAVPSKWRASYGFIPIKKNQLPTIAQKNGENDRENQRKWWLSIAENQTPDRLNKLPRITAAWGISSPLHIPDADVELGWQDWEGGLLKLIAVEEIVTIKWHSSQLKNQRDCCFFSTAKGNAPLVILLDGQKWDRDSGTLSVLQYLTKTEKIAPAHYLLIPSINNKVRGKELGCDHDFWLAIVNELLPEVDIVLDKFKAAISDRLVAGQSLGGLSALYAGLHFPEYFSKVITLSGSFWWPEVERMQNPDIFKLANPEWASKVPKNSLAEQILNGRANVSHLQIFQTIGLAEKDMCVYNDMMYQAIKKKGGIIHYDKVCGGHDWLSWRSGLVNGLIKLLPVA